LIWIGYWLRFNYSGASGVGGVSGVSGRGNRNKVRVSLEATGIYSLDLALALDAEADIEVAVLHPTDEDLPVGTQVLNPKRQPL
jgi:hypothetical protein